MPDTPRPSVAVLGTGAMGSRMALRLLEAGFPLTVWNRTPGRAEPLTEKGATLAATPAEAVAGACFALAMVEGDDASQTVWCGPEGVFGALDRSAIAIECSTISPAHAETLGEEAARCEARLIVAPVSGSLPQVEAGVLVFLAGGAPGDVAGAEPVFRHLGKSVYNLGSPRQASLAKLAVNGLLACHVLAAAEFHHLLRKGGLSAEAMASFLSDTPVASPITLASLRQFAVENHSPLFPISLALKDLEYLVAAAALLETQVPMATCARALFGRARAWKSQNISAIAKLLSSTLPERKQE